MLSIPALILPEHRFIVSITPISIVHNGKPLAGTLVIWNDPLSMKRLRLFLTDDPYDIRIAVGCPGGCH